MLTAASLTGEVFKIITGLKSGNYRHVDILDFCPVTYGTPSAVIPGPPHFERLALAGAGAIGTAIALILDALDATGELIVVDRQYFEDPNVISYSLGTIKAATARLPKVQIVKAAIRNMDVQVIHGTIDDLIAQIDVGNVAMPRIVLGAVDNIAARHDIQRIYSDLVLDGGTGGRAGTTVGLHEAFPTGPCMRCYFPTATATLTAEQLLHNATGLPMQRIARGDRPLTEDDLLGLVPPYRQLLQPHLGKPICGLGRLLGLTTVHGDDSYQPSAAFVAQQAASLVVGALIARTTAGEGIPARHVEYDTLFGPGLDMTDLRRARSGCYCQTNTDIIRAVRATRGGRFPNG